MFIDKYKKENGYYDENNCFYPSAEDFIQCGIFHFCGCGIPSENLKYIATILEKIKQKNNNWSVSEIFCLYVLDNLGLAEHGCGINNCWLTAKGKSILEDIKELYEQKL
jgi:hypothetical protein